MKARAIPLLLGILLLVIITACEGTKTAAPNQEVGSKALNTPKDVASKALDAMIEGDGDTFNSLVSPDRRVRANQGPGLTIGLAEVEIVGGCDSVKVEYLERATDEIANGREITLLFESPCLDFGTGAKRDLLRMVVERVNDRWYLFDIRE